MNLPDMYRLHQSFEKDAIENIESTVSENTATAAVAIDGPFPLINGDDAFFGIGETGRAG